MKKNQLIAMHVMCDQGRLMHIYRNHSTKDRKGFGERFRLVNTPKTTLMNFPVTKSAY